MRTSPIPAFLLASLTATLMAAAMPSQAQGLYENLLVNPGNEDALVDGEIPGWTVVSGTWYQRERRPEPTEGSFAFAAVEADAVLRQVVDLRQYPDLWAEPAVTFVFEFDAWGAWQRRGTSEPIIKVSRLNEDLIAPGSDSYHAPTRRGEWVTWGGSAGWADLLPYMQVDIFLNRGDGFLDRSYVDNLSLIAVPTPLPEPATAALLALGVAAVAWRAGGHGRLRSGRRRGA